MKSLTELSPSWEVASCAATQELPSNLWNPKVHKIFVLRPECGCFFSLTSKHITKIIDEEEKTGINLEIASKHALCIALSTVVTLRIDRNASKLEINLWCFSETSVTAHKTTLFRINHSLNLRKKTSVLYTVNNLQSILKVGSYL
jgi:hypothetical protein